MVKILNRVFASIGWLKKIRKNTNSKMSGKYSANRIGVIAAAMCMLLLILMLFVPPYLGVADDGSVSKVMESSGIYYIEEEPEDIYGNYFIKKYSNILSNSKAKSEYKAGQVLFIKLALHIDDFFTKDTYFDIRFLSLLYGLLFLPAVWLIVKQASSRVLYFSEGSIIGIAGVFIFADVSYLTYFNSFYPEAIWYISLLYCVGLGLSLFNKKHLFIKILLFAVFGMILTTSRQQCAVIGIFLVSLCIRYTYLNRKGSWKVLCIILSFVLSIITILSGFTLDSDFNQISKYHAMTRGVLFQSSNPEQALKEFGIAEEYTLLTDTSFYSKYPFVQEDATILQEGFYDKYTETDIALYYLKHPVSFIGMLDLSVKAAFNIRRDYCGNYEKSAGRMEKSKSLFWSGWSTFKTRSAPNTIGYLVILVIACFLLYGRKRTLENEEGFSRRVYFDMMIFIICVAISQVFITIVWSGDAEFSQHIFLTGLGIDLLSYFVFAEILHKLNIIEEGGKK